MLFFFTLVLHIPLRFHCNTDLGTGQEIGVSLTGICGLSGYRFWKIKTPFFSSVRAQTVVFLPDSVGFPSSWEGVTCRGVPVVLWNILLPGSQALSEIKSDMIGHERNHQHGQSGRWQKCIETRTLVPEETTHAVLVKWAIQYMCALRSTSRGFQSRQIIIIKKNTNPPAYPPETWNLLACKMSYSRQNTNHFGNYISHQNIVQLEPG